MSFSLHPFAILFPKHLRFSSATLCMNASLAEVYAEARRINFNSSTLILYDFLPGNLFHCIL